MPCTLGNSRLQAGQTKPPAWSLSKLALQFKQRKIACKSADRRDCVCSSIIAINLQEMTRFLRRRSRPGIGGLLFVYLQQDCGKGHREIGKELVGFRSEQRSNN